MTVIKMKSFESRDGIKISYHLWNGTKNKKWMVFIHGLGGNLTTWEKIIKKLKKKYNLVAMDLRGHGRSARPRKKSVYEHHHNAEDVIDLLNHLKIKKATIVGHSSGALVALDTASRFPKRVDSIVLLAPNHADIFKHYPVYKKLLKPLFLRFCRVTARLARHIPHKRLVYPSYSRLKSASPICTVYNDMLGNTLDVYFWNMLEYLNAKVDLKKVVSPTILIHGTKDNIVSIEFSRTMSKKLANAELIEIKDGKHQLTFYNYEQIVDILNKK